MSPTKRSLDFLRKTGFMAAVVERWNMHAKIRQDVFGFGDILASREGVGILLIQATSASNHAARMNKIRIEPRALQWLLAGGRIEVWSWAKRGARGEPKRWELRREEVTAETMVVEAPTDLFGRRMIA
jgi:hypothetical protein